MEITDMIEIMLSEYECLLFITLITIVKLIKVIFNHLFNNL